MSSSERGFGGENEAARRAMHRIRPRPARVESSAEPLVPLDIETITEIARDAVQRDRGHGLTVRLAALEAATERAIQTLDDRDWTAAVTAWTRVTFAAESIFGPDDASVLDAMRITALVMRRLDLVHDATHILCEAAERTLRSEGPDAPRLQRIRAELEASLAA